ncbi:MAG: lipid kinase YegS [Polyangiaceae bacterium]|nr:lipid kinase YegS [Polyangiaceae bacterium]
MLSSRQHWTLILNGKSAGNELVREAVKALRDRGVELSVRVTWEAGDVDRYVAEAVLAKVDTIVAAGGDGTLSEVANALAQQELGADELPSLGLIPLGTANDFATATQIPTEPLAALELIATQRPCLIDLIRVQTRDSIRWFANLASGGFGTQVTVETPEGMKRLLGGLAYLLTGLAKIGSGNVELTPVTLSGPDFSWQGGCLALGIGNGCQAGGGQVLCPDARLDDGLIDLTVIPELEESALSVTGVAMKEGRTAALDQIAVRTKLPWLELRSPKPMTLNLDGEPVESDTFRIECWPGRARIHLPAGCGLVQQA